MILHSIYGQSIIQFTHIHIIFRTTIHFKLVVKLFDYLDCGIVGISPDSPLAKYGYV